MKTGIQLFGCMKLFHADPDGFLNRLQAAGYSIIEPCVLFGDMPAEFGWRSEDIRSHADRLERHHLELPTYSQRISRPSCRS